jgi:hypothetical protein
VNTDKRIVTELRMNVAGRLKPEVLEERVTDILDVPELLQVAEGQELRAMAVHA